MIPISVAEQNAWQSGLPKNLTLNFPFSTALTNDDIYMESAQLEQAICEESNLTFGMVYSSCFTVRIFDTGVSYTGQRVLPQLSVTDGNVTFTRSFGNYTVKSDKLTSDKLYRDLVCYDYLTDVLPVSFVQWHNSRPATFTMKQYRDAFFQQIQLTQKSINLPNDNVQLKKFTVTELTGADILACILQLNGAFGYIDYDGEFRYVLPKTTVDYTIDDNSFVQGSLVYEDEPIKPITGVKILGYSDDYGDEGSYSVADASAGNDTGNVLVIENNNLIQSCPIATRQTLCTNLYNSLKNYTYYPASVNLPVYIGMEPGDVFKIETDRKDITFQVFQRTITGITALMDHVVAEGQPDLDENAGSVMSGVSSTTMAINQVRESVAELLAQKASIEAQDAAIAANIAANSALTQLSVVEDVAGTLRWISEHGTFNLTEDTTVHEGTVYFIYQGGDYVPIAQPDPTANPSEEGWYILDVTDSQASYIMAHLAVTNAGLWILPVNGLAAHPLVDSDGNQIVDSDGNPIVDFSSDPQNADGYKVLLANNGMSIYNGEGAVVANYGVTITLGEDGRPRLRIKPTGMALLSASNSEVFEIRPDQTDNVNKGATVVTYQSDSSVTATSYTISDTSTSTAEAPYIELSVNGGEPFAFSTGVTATATQGVGVTVTVTSTGVSAILDQMRYTTTVDTYATTQDTTVDPTKTYYVEEDGIYTAVIPVGDEDPASEGWCELSSTTTTSYYPCTMTVTYSAISDIRTAIMDMIGRIDIDGAGNPIMVTNNDWTSSKKTDTFIRVKNNTTGVSVGFGVSSGGYNHGIWSYYTNSWIIYVDKNKATTLPGLVTNFQRGHGKYIQITNDTSEGAVIQAISKGKAVSLYSSTAGNRGIYDTYRKRWIIYSPSNGGVVVPQNLKCDGLYRTSNTSIYRAYTYNGVTRFGYGSGAEVLRFVTRFRSRSSDSQGVSFMLGNGGYAVGSDGTPAETSNNIYLSGGADADGRYIKSYVTYERIYNYAANVYMTSSGTFGRSSSSSIRYKHDVEYLTNEENSTIDEEKKLSKKKLLKGTENDLSSILDIPVVKFKFNEGYITGEKDFDYEKPIVGLIADDVAKIVPEVATYIEDDKGEKIPEAWDSNQLLVRMLYVVQQQEKRIAELEERVKVLEGGLYGK